MQPSLTIPLDIPFVVVRVIFHRQPSGRGRAVYTRQPSSCASGSIRSTAAFSLESRALFPRFLVLNGMGREVHPVTKLGTEAGVAIRSDVNELGRYSKWGVLADGWRCGQLRMRIHARCALGSHARVPQKRPA